MSFFDSIKEKLGGQDSEEREEGEEGYVELDTETEEIKSKIIVRPFVLTDFEDTRTILDTLREGNTVLIINIKPLKDKDLVELKRAINKIKKTTDAIEGEIAGFSEDFLIVTPSFAEIYRSKQTSEVKEETQPKQEEPRMEV
ncbi:MAG: cell division protein SepF [Candidatus Woesearchaeota archaeon]|jgi:SepF-like predicted cell division protein (DUF552 family)|nr:cell division protein SepF [Candidatus Woesearchaeota archaeon]MDP7323778.1 cell division protein SepF [Candidatus Woesearchaeota archaeon]